MNMQFNELGFYLVQITSFSFSYSFQFFFFLYLYLVVILTAVKVIEFTLTQQIYYFLHFNLSCIDVKENRMNALELEYEKRQRRKWKNLKINSHKNTVSVYLSSVSNVRTVKMRKRTRFGNAPKEFSQT